MLATLLPIPTKNGDLRPVLHMRVRNQAIKKIQFSIAGEMSQTMESDKGFTGVDIQKGDLQISLAKES